MNRLHVHVSVDDLDRNIRFYTTMFGSEPVVVKDDYAKWSVEDPAVNFAISARGKKTGLDHIGIQAESSGALQEIRTRLDAAEIAGLAQEGTACCYAKSDKYWVTDPQGIAWETFHTLDSIPTFNEGDESDSDNACCVPETSSGCCPG